jgi:hypothetical protein
VFLFVVTPPPREPIGRYVIARVEGEDSAFRGDSPGGEGTFNPNSQVTIKIEPESGRAASIVRVYRIEESVLVEVPAAVAPGIEGVFLIEGSGRELFGGTSGKKRLVIVAADEGADLSRIAGRTMMAAQSLTTQTFWLTVPEIEYRAE